MPSVFYFEVEYSAPPDDWNGFNLIDHSDTVYNLLEELHENVVITNKYGNTSKVKYFVKNKRTAEQLLKKVEQIMDDFECEIIEIDF